MTPESAALSQVICDIYDAAVDSGRWPDALRSACDFVGGHEARLYWHGPSDGVDTLYQYNCDPHFTRLYEEQYVALNPLFPSFFFQSVGAVIAASDLVPHPDMRQTRFGKEWLAPQGLTDSLAVILEKETTRGAIISMQWRNSEIDADARARMELLGPHLQRAVSIGRLFVRHAVAERALTQTLDHFETGVFLIAANGRIVFANVSGQRMIADGKLVWSSRDVFRAAAPDADRALTDELRALGKTDHKTSARGLTVTLSETPGQRWIAYVLPLAEGVRSGIGDEHGAVAAVFVRNSMFVTPTPLETLAREFGLTASEIRVVEAVLRISGIDAMAEALGISRATVKTHLNRVYRKCGAKNQSDLIKLVAGIGH